MKKRVSLQLSIMIILFGIVIVKGAQYAWNYSLPENSQIPSSTSLLQTSTRASNPSYTRQEGLVVASTDYESIIENNLFRPLGWEKQKPSPPPRTMPVRQMAVPVSQPPPPRVRYLTLTGIAQNGPNWLAILEDTGDQEAYFVRQGEALRNGFVREITSEHVVLHGDGAEATLALGQSIRQGPGGLLRFEPVSHQPSLAADTRSEMEPTLEDNGEMSLLERMRARRQRELSQ